jgi:hypothetical protein
VSNQKHRTVLKLNFLKNNNSLMLNQGMWVGVVFCLPKVVKRKKDEFAELGKFACPQAANKIKILKSNCVAAGR